MLARALRLSPRVKPPGVETPTRRAEPVPSTAPPRGKPRFLLPILLAILLVLMLVAALWLGRTDNVVSRFFGAGSDASEVAAAVPVAVPLALPEDPVAPETDTTDVAVLPEDPAPETAPDPVPEAVTDIAPPAILPPPPPRTR